MSERKKPILMQVLMANSSDGKSGELKTVRADAIESSGKQHSELTAEQTKQADELFGRIGHYFSRSRAEWRDGFLHDLHPEIELRVWKHIANVVDYLWVEEPKALAPLKRNQLAILAVAVSNRIVDIPAHLQYADDAMVTIVKHVLSGRLLDEQPTPACDAETHPEEELLSRVTVDPAIVHGKPCIRGLRYPVDFVLDLLDSGMSDDEILADYPDLEPLDLTAAVLYASHQRLDRRLESQLAGA